MSGDIPYLGIPALRINPFHARSLEAGQSRLLVGRGDLTATWTRFLKIRNARMILLVGESGTGRSSLMRCLSEETEKSVHLDMFPSDDPVSAILHEVYVTLVGFDVPSSTQELVSRLVLNTESTQGSLPLISLDFSNADGKKLADVLATLVNPLNRLNALVIVSLTTDQRAQIPASLVNNFDHSTVIKPLTEQEVKKLCESRIASASNISWNLTEEALLYVMENTKGNPSKVMRLLRDMVDEERSNPRDTKYEEPSIDYQKSEIKISYPEEDIIEQEETENGAIFDLDLDKLAEVPVVEKKPSIPPPLPSMGAFGRLAARNRVNKEASPPFDKKNAPRIAQDSPDVDANSLWVANQPEAVLIEEEPIMDYLPEPEELIHTEEEYVEPISPNQSNGNVEILFTQLLDALDVPKGVGVADLLAAIRRPVIGQKESNPLDMQTLRSLSRGEAILVEVAAEREFSPSDARLQDKLDVRRPRMSQMCNRLYRGGILSVQQRGRTRMFKLTNDARAQLVAWGMMEASV